MSFIKRAITSIIRKPGKAAILLALVFVLGNVIAGSISVGQSVRNTEAAVLGGITPIATMEMDWTAISEAHDLNDIDWGDPDALAEYHRVINQYVLTAERIETLGALPSVEFFDYRNQFSLTSHDMERFSPPESQPGMGMRDRDDGWPEHFTLNGSQTSDMVDLRMGVIELVDGRTLSDSEIEQGEHAVLVSKNFAEQNSLHVGSVFTLEYEILDWDSMARVERRAVVREDVTIEMPEIGRPTPVKVLDFEFTVVGIFDLVTRPGEQIDRDDWQAIHTLTERNNAIYTSNRAIRTISEIIFHEDRQLRPDAYDDNAEVDEHFTPFFAFSSTADLDAFRRDVAALLGDYYRITDNMGDFSDVVAPMRNMSRLANIILYVGIGASLIILSLLVTLFLKDRRKEIGIYLALGERKTKIVGQVLVEVLIVSILGITLSLFSGNVISGQLSNSMIEDAVIAQQEEANNDNMWGGGMIVHNPLDTAGFGVDVTLRTCRSSTA